MIVEIRMLFKGSNLIGYIRETVAYMQIGHPSEE